MADFQSAIERLKKSWQATDDWDSGLSGENAASILYTANFEHALVTGHTLIFFGSVIDIHSNEDGTIRRYW